MLGSTKVMVSNPVRGSFLSTKNVPHEKINCMTSVFLLIFCRLLCHNTIFACDLCVFPCHSKLFQSIWVIVQAYIYSNRIVGFCQGYTRFCDSGLHI